MALDWSSRFNLTGFARRTRPQRETVPSKTYINLVPVDENELSGSRTAILGVLLGVLVLAFVKFGVYDFYARLAATQATLNERTAAYDALEAQLTDYDSIQEEYNLYEAARMVSDASDVAALDALGLVDKVVSPVASVSKVSLAGSTLSLELASSSLDSTGSLVSALYQSPLVQSVSVATATDTEGGGNAVVSMTIQLKADTNDDVTALIEKTDETDAQATDGSGQ